MSCPTSREFHKIKKGQSSDPHSTSSQTHTHRDWRRERAEQRMVIGVSEVEPWQKNESWSFQLSKKIGQKNVWGFVICDCFV